VFRLMFHTGTLSNKLWAKPENHFFDNIVLYQTPIRNIINQETKETL
jgi:hypothetical protein